MTIFPDSNIFIHFQSIEYINWKKLSKLSEPVKIVIPLVVIQEIDKHKYNSKNNISRRAAEVSNKIEEWTSQQNQKKFSVQLELFKTPSAYFIKNRLDETFPDDQLLAAILYYKDRNSNESIFLCSNDTGPRLKAQIFEVNTLKPELELQIKVEADAIDKENRELKIQVQKLKNLYPKLELRFPDEKGFYNYKIKKPGGWNQSWFDDEMSSVKVNYPYITFPEPNPNNPFAHLMPIRILPKVDYEKYNSELDEFYKKYETYLQNLHEDIQRRKLTLELTMQLINEGTCPAHDIKIHMHFPDGFELKDEESNSKIPTMPIPPNEPSIGGYSPLLPQFRFDIPKNPIHFGNRIKIRKTNSYALTKPVDKLNHGYVHDIDKLFVVYDSFDAVINFTIKYSITAGNLPESKKGKLHVIAEKQE